MNSARDRFERTRDAVKRLHEVKLMIMYDCEDWQPPNVKTKGNTSDPTATHAIYVVDNLEEKMRALRQEEQELETFIGESLAIIEAVRNGLGEDYANVLTGRYIDCFYWHSVLSVYNISSKGTAHRLHDIALDWIDSVGISHLLAGDYEL